MLNYYQVAKQASLRIDNHPGLVFVKNQCINRKKILDVGCGEGSRLEILTSKYNEKYGIDLSKDAIKLAKKNYPRSNFRVANAEKIPFSDGMFDLVFSAFTIEHTVNPEKIIEEMLRVVSDGGLVIIIAPNYGAPNRRSPNSIESPIIKMFKGLFLDFSTNNELNWMKVVPKKIYNQIDDDTTIEPYVYSLVKYLIKNGYSVNSSSSLWELEEFSLNPRKLITNILGRLKIFPFKYWGPQLFVVINK